MKLNAKTFRNVLSAILIVGLIMAAYKYLDIRLMMKAWQKFSWSSIGGLLALPIAYLLLKGWRFFLLLRAVEGELAAGPVMRGYLASQSASLLPGGFAARSAILTQADVPMERSLGPTLANSGLDQFVLLIFGLFLATWYPALRPAALGLLAALVVSIAVIWNDRSRAFLIKLLHKVADRFGHCEKVDSFVEGCAFMADWKLLAQTLALSVGADIASYAILCVVVGSLGFKLEYWPLAAAFVLPTLLGRLSPLPAGAGVTEAGMVTFMAHHTSLSVDEAAAATALMRIFDVVVPALYGGLVYALAWRGEKESAEVDSAGLSGSPAVAR